MPVPKVPSRHTHRPPPSVEIIAVPSGQAPLWVRQAWVGLVLPIWIDGVQTHEVYGVLTRPPRTALGRWIMRVTGRTGSTRGYVIHAHTAIEILAKHAPDAADWWQGSAPQFMAQDASFMFEEAACKPVRPQPPKPANT